MRRASAALLAALAVAAPAAAKTVYVRNDGLDGAACGAKASPCRSITRAIAQAAAGDTVLVGPGRYGDLDVDGTVGEPGEEGGAAGLVDLDKPVHVFSTDGADATAIAAPSVTALDPFVQLSADGAVFGRRNGGFTIVGEEQGIGIRAVGLRTTVAGNVVLATLTGISIEGADSVAADNRVSLCGTGMEILGAGAVAERNALVGNLSGGLELDCTGCEADANVLVANGVGLGASSSEATVRRALVAGNRANGASITGGGVAIESSSFFGNGDELAMNPNCGLLTDASPVSATGNYWGSPLGPGHDPADLVCSESVGFEPFATKGGTIKLKPIR